MKEKYIQITKNSCAEENIMLVNKENRDNAVEVEGILNSPIFLHLDCGCVAVLRTICAVSASLCLLPTLHTDYMSTLV